MGKVGSVEHVLEECHGWEKERGELWEGIGEIDRSKMAMLMGGGRRERVEWLMRGGEGRRMRDLIMKKLAKIWYSYEAGVRRVKDGVGGGVDSGGAPTQARVSGWSVVEGGRKKICGGRGSPRQHSFIPNKPCNVCM